MMNLVWKLLYPHWQVHENEMIPGYTLFLPVPGDLPFFLRLALDICQNQNLEYLQRIFIIPDRLNSDIYRAFEKCNKKWNKLPLQLVKLTPLQRLLIKFTNNPNHICWFQLIQGVNACYTTHAFLHDADAFILDSYFFKTQYETCIQGNFDCVGASMVWDHWFKNHGIHHLVATWEILMKTDWIRRFPPWKHHGHVDRILDKKHVFDTTLWPQCKTAADKIHLIDHQDSFVHFNYVISTYRWFQHSKGHFEDEHFRILLIRLLNDIYQDGDDKCSIPTIKALVRGIQKKEKVTYFQARTWQHYPEFRFKLEKLLASLLLETPQANYIREAIFPFDEHYKTHL